MRHQIPRMNSAERENSHWASVWNFWQTGDVFFFFYHLKQRVLKVVSICRPYNWHQIQRLIPPWGWILCWENEVEGAVEGEKRQWWNIMKMELPSRCSSTDTCRCSNSCRFLSTCTEDSRYLSDFVFFFAKHICVSWKNNCVFWPTDSSAQKKNGRSRSGKLRMICV